MEILTTVIGVSIPLLGHLGLMIWWMSRTNTKIEVLSTSQKEQTDKSQRMAERVQALEVNEANVGGTLSTLALEIKHIADNLRRWEQDNGNVLQLKLDKQSSELMLKFRDMLRDETAKAIREHMRDKT